MSSMGSFFAFHVTPSTARVHLPERLQPDFAVSFTYANHGRLAYDPVDGVSFWLAWFRPDVGLTAADPQRRELSHGR